MLAIDIKRYLEHNKTATLSQLSNQFDMNPDNMRDLLSMWVKKGKIKLTGYCDTKDHANCNTPQDEIYEWLEDPYIQA
jgi:putative ferrous iron transport protein C